MNVQVFGVGCPNCEQLEANVRKAVSELGADVNIEKITDVNDIVSYGVMMTPAFAVEGKIQSTGEVLSVDEIKEILKAT